MQQGIFRGLRDGDIQFLARNLRSADRREMSALHGLDPVEGILKKSIRLSTHTWVLAAPEGELLALFGVAPIVTLKDGGAPWLLGTEKLFEYPRTLLRDGRRFVAQMLDLYPHLMNVIDQRNTRSIRWLKRLGFTFHEPRPMGYSGLPFHIFEMRKETNNV